MFYLKPIDRDPVACACSSERRADSPSCCSVSFLFLRSCTLSPLVHTWLMRAKIWSRYSSDWRFLIMGRTEQCKKRPSDRTGV
eukprot:748443-Hanusia_phi.AAC.3